MKILIVEDEPLLSKSIQDYLESFDFNCESASRLDEALAKTGLYDYDCILLDLGLPDGEGFDLLKNLKQRQKTEGVIIISARESLETRIEGFKYGADDFLVKPFHLSELLVRTQALIRRRNFSGQNTICFNEFKINVLSKQVFIHEREVPLTKKELDLLLFLLSNRDKVVSKASIAEHLSGDMADLFDNHDFVYAHIKNLKRKLLEAGSGDYIKTVYGLGYRWENEN